MKCPHCNYKNGWGEETLSVATGTDGEFYEVAGGLYATRPSDMPYPDKKTVYACPSCMKVFIS